MLAPVPAASALAERHINGTQTRNSVKRSRSVTTYSVKLSNQGSVDSDEVVQVYMVPQFTRAGVATPKRQLIDFARIHVKCVPLPTPRNLQTAILICTQYTQYCLSV
jgi:hypothetical protein